MKTPLRVSSKAKLADALGVSRVTVYQYLRLPDSPPPRNGYYYVAEWRKFITRKRAIMETGEKQQLQLELLKTKIETARNGLDTIRAAERQRILDELSATFTLAMWKARREFDRAITELAPRFEGLSARAMYGLWRERTNQACGTIIRELNRKSGAKINATETEPTIIQFAAEGKPYG
jgi:hypothetical protein